MRNPIGSTIASCAFALAFFAGALGAQAPAAPGQAPAAPVSTAVASPTYVSIPMEIEVNRPAAEVWKRVGKYCDIGEWFQIACTITAGKDGEFGAVRSVATEVLVGKTELCTRIPNPYVKADPTTSITARSRQDRLQPPHPSSSTHSSSTIRCWLTKGRARRTSSRKGPSSRGRFRT